MSQIRKIEATAVGITESALELAALELSVIPIQRGSKQPIGSWMNNQFERMGDAEIRRRFSQYTNLAVVCGAVSRVVVVDSDGPEALQWVRANLADTDLMTRTPRGGLHLWYRHGGVQIRNRAKIRGMPLDVRGDRGYVLVPPSINLHGTRYEWVNEPTRAMLNNLPVFDPEWLAEEQRYEPSPIVRIGEVVDEVIDRRIRAYMSRVEGAVSGQGGHNKTMYAAGCLIQKWGLSVEDAMPYMIEWNRRCQPPWEIKDLRRKLEECLKKKEGRSCR
ncbi:MAG: bifunctional DNA primase/polymerase [Planctomycetes bacterium]|nr:bifunctional DNA primase/polymerase [Planctomycetota bacterium]